MIDAVKQLVAETVTITPGTGDGEVNIPHGDANDLFNGVLTLVYFVAGVTCVIVIVVAGILYALSEGDATKVKTAKNAVLYAVAGLVIVMMAFVITQFVIGRFI